jgi:antirestriction protein ArdC
MNKDKITVQEVITDRFLQCLKSGKIPWRMPWKVGHAKNLVSKKAYQGVNALMLSMAGGEFFVTYKQCVALGGHVKAGSHGFPIAFYSIVKGKVKPDGTSSSFPILKYFTVFKTSDCEGLNVPEPVDNKNDKIAVCEELVSSSGAEIVTGSKACYNSGTDQVTMPELKSFETSEHYYATLFHELTHWTGGKKRLDRKLGNGFGSEAYAFEELIAEIGSAFLNSHTGIENNNLIENEKAYIQSWIECLQNDPKMIIQASSKAQKAFALLTKSEEAEAEEVA